MSRNSDGQEVHDGTDPLVPDPSRVFRVNRATPAPWINRMVFLGDCLAGGRRRAANAGGGNGSPPEHTGAAGESRNHSPAPE
jgi:hypothetical protein